MNATEVVGLCVVLFWVGAVALPAWCVLARFGVRSKLMATGAILLAGWSLVGLVGWKLADHYTGAGINLAALFHLPMGLTGLSWSMRAPLIALGVVGAASFVVVGAWIWRGRLHPSTPSRMGRVAFAVSGALLLANPGWLQLGLIALQTGDAQDKYDALVALAHTDTQPPTQRRSIVHIYLEGVDGSLLSPQLTPKLWTLSQDAVRIRGVRQAEYTGWTLAGLVSSTCGYPPMNDTLRPDGMGPCAGEILASHGWQQTYLNGASLTFSGKDTFWKQQGYQRLLGDTQVRDLAGDAEAPLSGWGAYDETLLKAARIELKQLSEENKPFVLTLLTLDTHSPFAPSPACNPTKPYDLKQSLACSDELVGSFIQDIRQQYPDVVIVLQSDHQATRAPEVRALLDTEKQRDNLVVIWGSLHPNETIHREGTMFDMAPTVLTLAGVPTRSLNLGRDLLDPESRPIVQAKGLVWLNAHLAPLLRYQRQVDTPTAQAVAGRQDDWKTGKQRDRAMKKDPALAEKLGQDKVPSQE